MGANGKGKSKPNPRNQNGNKRKKARAWVFATFDHCGICGLPVDKSLKPYRDERTGKMVFPPMMGEVDEIIPVSLGGSPYDHENLRLAHRICNQKRGNKMRRNTARRSPKPMIKHSQVW